MTKPKLYIETSVVSYFAARPSRDLIVLAHQEITKEFWEERLARFNGFVSRIVLDEAGDGDPSAAKARLDLLKRFLVLPVTDEVDRLAAMYLAENVVPPRALRDAYHIALASVHEIDYLATWNCAHIGSGQARKQIRELNDREGILTPIICSPESLMEVIEYVERSHC